jgi:TRAP-type C4-dicarboxylate transport system permease small subunit
MDRFEKFVSKTSFWFNRISQWALAVMMLVVIANMVTRLFGHPVPGTYEITGYLGAVVIGFALAWCGALGHHIALTMAVDKLPERPRAIVSIVTGILSVGFLLLAVWQLWRMGMDSMQMGELSPDLRFSFYPLIWGVALGCLLLSLVFLVNVLKTLTQEVRKWIPLRSV